MSAGASRRQSSRNRRHVVGGSDYRQDCWKVPVIDAESSSLVCMAKRTWTLAASSGMSRCSLGMAWTVWM